MTPPHHRPPHRPPRSVPTRHTLLLTGTPIQNHLTELWALVDLVAPGLLGDLKVFKSEYESTIAAAAARCAQPAAQRTGSGRRRIRIGPLARRITERCSRNSLNP